MESENAVSLTGGTIADLIQERKEKRKGNWPILSETDSLGYLEDVLKAVKFLHSKGLVHSDIKGNMKTEFSCLLRSVHRVPTCFQKNLQTRNDTYILLRSSFDWDTVKYRTSN